MKKCFRIISIVLAFCLCLTMLPALAMQVEAASNIVINGIDIGYAHGSYFTKNGSTCKDNNNYHSNGEAKATCHNRRGYDCVKTTDPSCNCMRYWPTGSASTCQIDLKASQCFGFARYCQWKVYGTYDVNSPSAFTDIAGDISSENCTGAYLKQKLINCAPATHLRTFSTVKGWGHSICIISTTDYGVNFADCNSDGCCIVRYKTVSWDELAAFVKGYGGIDYANSYKDAKPSHTSHTYTGSYYEAAHPHRVYQKCSCGATQYTGATTTVSTCETCNPVSTSSKYNAVLSFRAYLKGTSKVYPYTTAQLATTSGGEIWSTDECTISAVYSNGACKVSYPVGTTTKTAYTQLSNFIGDTSASLTRQTVSRKATTYIRDNTGSTAYGYIDSGDVIYKLGTSGGMTQIFYPTSSGYKLAWVVTSELTEPTYDNRFNPYCPINGFPCAGDEFDVYASDHATVTGEIWTSDYCAINAVYADGWCQVTYPVGSTTKTAYTKLSNFVYDVSATHIKYTANTQIKVHKDKSLPGDMNWFISSGDQFFVVGSYGSTSQVLYPIDEQYGGGYKLGWISTGDLPKTTYTVSYNANGGSGAPSSQTKTHGVALKLSTAIPTRSGYAFVGWATSSSATSATYTPGASYTADVSITLYAVWTLNKYEISYDANGGTNAPSTQNKAHGTNLTLSTVIPSKQYSVTFDANGGSVDIAARQIACKFLGWATSSAATTAAYQPGGTFTTNANTTLYAVWENSALGACPVPVRGGYVFDGWYTAENGGSLVSASTVLSSNMTVYAHWTVATYGIYYDANGGNNAPAEQIKTHGQDLKLSTSVPIREGYTFLGWAMDENPTEVQYQPGDIYSEDIGIMLVAVWEQAALSKLEIQSFPDKTTYYVGDTLDTAGLALKATFSDGSQKTITEGFTCSHTTFVSAGPQTVQVSYGGHTVSFTVQVKEKERAIISVGEVLGEAGETVTVAINLDKNPGLIGARIHVAFDSSVLTLIDVKDNGILGEYQFGGDLNVTPYTMFWENGLSESNLTSTGTLVYLTFKIADNATAGEYAISITGDPSDFYNKDMEDVPVIFIGGKLTVDETVAPENQIVLEFSEGRGVVGSVVRLKLHISNLPEGGISSLDLSLDYDPTQLKLTSVPEDGGILGEHMFGNNIALVPYGLTWNNLENITAEGILATLEFEILRMPEDGVIKIRVTGNECADLDENIYAIAEAEGVITKGLPGDVNGDGKITQIDVTRLRKYLAGGWDVEIDEAAADVNGDGKITQIDVTRLRKYLAGGWDIELG